VSKYRRAAKVDSNQPAIVDELRRCGYSVEVNHDDILVGYQGRTYWYEIKELGVISKKNQQVRPSEIKDSQKKLLENFKGHYKIVWTAQQIIEDIKADD
jgi:hypothetical protein